MRYARTKYASFPIAYERDKPNSDEPLMFADGTIAFINDEDIVHLGHPRCSSFYARKQHIIKEAGNIAELCDYVWYKDKYHETTLERVSFDVASVMRKPRIDGAFEYVRFMILVGKDLKTVAEMNEKGDVELV